MSCCTRSSLPRTVASFSFLCICNLTVKCHKHAPGQLFEPLRSQTQTLSLVSPILSGPFLVLPARRLIISRELWWCMLQTHSAQELGAAYGPVLLNLGFGDINTLLALSNEQLHSIMIKDAHAPEHHAKMLVEKVALKRKETAKLNRL